MNIIFSTRPLPAFETVYALIRIVTGFFVAYHGWEVFNTAQINDYGKWLTDLHFPAPYTMAWLGKGTELVCGLGLLLGFATRLMAIPLIIIMLVIAFGMGHGKVWYEDQHPFMFVLLGVLYLFAGGGKWSLDGVLFKQN